MTEILTPDASPSLTANGMFNSLNGFDEIAIVKSFGSSVTDLRGQPTTFLRALAFVDVRRQDHRDADAYAQVMRMPLGLLESYFADEPAAGDEDSPAGKEQPPSS